LGTDGSNLTDVSGVGSLPFNSKRVSTILEEDNIVAITGIFDGIHIGKLSTHVRDEAEFNVGVFNELLLEILDVQDVVVIRLYVDGLSSSMLNSTRNSSKSKGITQCLIGQEWKNDVRVVLFVKMREGQELTDVLIKGIKSTIRTECTPRHVPAKILEVSDIPRTKSGKIVEISVRDIVHGREIKNKESLANPEALEFFKNRVELLSI
jgi:acyl-CoA synthetase (AMP-forming)/AMP-acid ligase II